MAATDLLRAGVDIRVIQRLLGHESVAATMVYTQVVGRRMAEAVLHLPSFETGAQRRGLLAPAIVPRPEELPSDP